MSGWAVLVQLPHYFRVGSRPAEPTTFAIIDKSTPDSPTLVSLLVLQSDTPDFALSTDIDECGTEQATCGADQFCVNTEGSYECRGRCQLLKGEVGWERGTGDGALCLPLQTSAFSGSGA